ncbi:MAG: alanyl-tRNA editing protein, partial [Boseongicola sp. SB0677_bin_26]|nr:alanyl-tRNA editing protein [Boseongicola sp. SB0677_bin_26]
MTDALYRDAYLREATGQVDTINERGGIVLDACVFYPTGGGQPGDCGLLRWEGG